MSETGNLLIVSAPSGAGKTSLVKALLRGDDQVAISISHTTRAKRPAERNGVDYHFVDENQFADMLKQSKFLESAQVHGARYGTAQSSVDALLSAGHDVILEIDWQGAEQVRKVYPNAKSIFVLPPSVETLATRLKTRGQDPEEVILQRVAAAREEMAQVASYDYVIINNDFEVALQEFKAIVVAERLKTPVQQSKHAKLIQALMA